VDFASVASQTLLTKLNNVSINDLVPKESRIKDECNIFFFLRRKGHKKPNLFCDICNTFQDPPVPPCLAKKVEPARRYNHFAALHILQEYHFFI
jgi:hypothetical protein